MKIPYQHLGWYIPVTIVLIVCYLIGCIIPFAIYYHGFMSEILIGTSQSHAISFLIGLLGANVQNSILFSKEINLTADSSKPQILPTYFEFFGYALKNIWGGIAAVIFILAVQSGFVAAFAHSIEVMRPSAIVVVSFVVGLRAFTILKKISGFLDPNQGIK